MQNVAGLGVFAVGVVFGVGMSALHAQPLLSVTDGFGSTSTNIWSTITTPENQAGSFVPSGGNPGTFGSLVARTSINNRTGTGYIYRGAGSDIFLRSSNFQIIFGADLRRSSVVNPGTPVPELVPVLLQGVRIYQPTSFIAGPTSNEWTTIAPVTFNLSEFSHSSGVPLNLSQSVTVGFWLRMNAAPTIPNGTSYGVGIDNVTITIIPAPTSGVLLALGALGAPVLTRRRRK